MLRSGVIRAETTRVWVFRRRVECRSELSRHRRRQGLRLALSGSGVVRRADRQLSFPNQRGDGEFERAHPAGRRGVADAGRADGTCPGVDRPCPAGHAVPLHGERQVRCAWRLRRKQRAPRLHAHVHEVLIGFARPQPRNRSCSCQPRRLRCGPRAVRPRGGRSRSLRQRRRAMVRNRVLFGAAATALAVSLAGCQPVGYGGVGYVAPVYAGDYYVGYGGPVYYGGGYYGGGYYGGYGWRQGYLGGGWGLGGSFRGFGPRGF